MTSTMRLKPGDAAPDAEVQGPEGPLRLASLWQEGPVLLLFLRHFG
jgi:hypothetical protein